MKVRRVASLVAVVLVVAGAVVAAALPRAVVVDVAPVDRGALVVTLEEAGTTYVAARAVIAAPAAGNLVKPALAVGDQVRQGEVVARLEPVADPLLTAMARAQTDAAVRAAEAAVAQSKAAQARGDAALQSARTQLERVEKLKGSGSATAVQVDDARAAVHALEHETEAAAFAVRVTEQQALAQRAMRGGARSGGDAVELTSPMDGVVLSVFAEHGGVVAPGSPILEIGDPRVLEVRLPLRTADALSLAPGARAVVSGWGGPDVNGHVRSVEPKAFTRLSALGVEEQRTQVIIDLDDPPPTPALGDAFGVHVSVVLHDLADAVRVPVGALLRRGAAWSVLMVKDGRATATAVKPGRRAGPLAEVLEGLAPGDTVVLYPGDRVKDGDRVKARPSAGLEPAKAGP